LELLAKVIGVCCFSEIEFLKEEDGLSEGKEVSLFKVDPFEYEFVEVVKNTYLRVGQGLNQLS
jgi:hypothetical protein